MTPLCFFVEHHKGFVALAALDPLKADVAQAMRQLTNLGFAWPEEKDVFRQELGGREGFV